MLTALFFTCAFPLPQDAGPVPPQCNCLDSDIDGDIDLADFGALQRAFMAE